jgi:CCR4-NOT transcription complex subunit 7/8
MSRSGYDFGYLIKLLTNACLPNDEKEFFDLLHIWFPSIYDVKFIMRSCKPLKGGLQDVADDLGVRDVGCFPYFSNAYRVALPSTHIFYIFR